MKTMKTILMLSVLTLGLLGFWFTQGLRSVAQEKCQPVSGDVNCDGALDISDPVALLSHLFLDGPPPVACANDEGTSVSLLMAGTFLTVNDTGGGATIQRHGDGTFSGYTSERFSVNLESLGVVNLGELLGSWKAEGDREFDFVGIQVARSVADNQIVGFVRYEGNGRYEPSYDSYDAESTLSVYGAARNPIDPGPEPPLAVLEASSTASRLIRTGW